MFGTIDACYIPIKCPSGRMESTKYRFVWAGSGFSGNSHDAIIFEATNLYRKITDGDLFPTISKQQGDCNIPPVIIGDSALHLEHGL